jgi:HEAT repeat protein
MGATLDSELQKRFPGRIRVDPFAPGTRLPSFSQCSGLTALLAARGAGSAAVVIPCLESNDRIKRFFSVYYLYAVHYPAALELLARRLYDAEPRNRFLAADALRTYRHEPGYRRIIQGLRDHLKVPVFEAQVATVQVLGQLRDPSAVPSLIPLVVSPRQALARASASALTVICGQAFGSEVARWAEWWQAHYNKPREAWLVEGMRHPDANVRRVAAREFQLLTGHTTPSESGATPEQRENPTPA